MRGRAVLFIAMVCLYSMGHWIGATVLLLVLLAAFARSYAP